MTALRLNFILEISLVFWNRVFVQHERAGHIEIESLDDSVPPQLRVSQVFNTITM